MFKINIHRFMATASNTDNTLRSDSGNKATLYIEYTEAAITNTDIANNTTTISGKASITQNTGSWAQIWSPYLHVDWYDNKRATWTEDIVQPLNVTSLSKGETKELPFTFTVPHKDDGSLSGKARARWVYTGGSANVARNGSVETVEVALQTVPRTNGFDTVDGVVGVPIWLYIDQKAPSLYTQVEWASGNYSGVVLQKGLYNGDNGWYMTSDDISKLYKAIGPYAQSAIVRLTATTYSGDYAIGYVSEDITVSINQADCKPTVSMTAKDIRPETTSLTDTDYKIINGQSHVSCNYGAVAKNEAFIVSVLINGVGVTIPDAGKTLDYVFYNAKTASFAITAIDSRGLQSDTYVVPGLTLINYVIPSITGVFERDTPMNGKVNLEYSGKVFNGSFGDVNNVDSFTVQYCYTEKNTEEYGDWIPIPITLMSDGTFSGELAPLEEDGIFEHTKVYTFKVSVSDSLYPLGTLNFTQDIFKGRPSPWFDEENMYIDGDYYQRDNTTDQLIKLPTLADYEHLKNTSVEAIYLGKNPDIDSLHYKNGTYGIYGCTQAPSLDMGALEVVLYTRDWVIQRFSNHYGDVWQREFTAGTTWGAWRSTNTIIESGSNENGSYIKYSDGTMICNHQFIPNYTNADYHFKYGIWYYPSAFVNTPIIQATANNWSVGMANTKVWAEPTYTNVMALSLNLYDMTPFVEDVIVNLTAYGRWK